MPLHEIRSIDSAKKLALWRIEETEEELKQTLLLDESELEFLGQMSSPEKRLHWLASRNAIRKLLGFPHPIHLKWTSSGQPSLTSPPHYVSISHCARWAAAMIGDRPLGVDLELCTSKIERISHKFVREDERSLIADISQAHLGLTLIWSTKEVLFKYHGIGLLNFRNHLRVVDLTLGKRGQIRAEILKPGYEERLTLHYEQIEPLFLMVWLAS